VWIHGVRVVFKDQNHRYFERFEGLEDEAREPGFPPFGALSDISLEISQVQSYYGEIPGTCQALLTELNQIFMVYNLYWGG
jgi:hypothetical protein